MWRVAMAINLLGAFGRIFYAFFPVKQGRCTQTDFDSPPERSPQKVVSLVREWTDPHGRRIQVFRIYFINCPE